MHFNDQRSILLLLTTQYSHDKRITRVEHLDELGYHAWQHHDHLACVFGWDGGIGIGGAIGVGGAIRIGGVVYTAGAIGIGGLIGIAIDFALQLLICLVEHIDKCSASRERFIQLDDVLIAHVFLETLGGRLASQWIGKARNERVIYKIYW